MPLSYTRLDADFDGVVTGRYAEPGQVVNAGQKIVTLARPEVREAVIAVPDALAEPLSHPNDFTITVDLDHVVSMKAAGVRAHRSRSPIRRPARATSSSPSNDPPDGLSPRHHRLGDLHAAGVAARRPAGNRAPREGRQGVRLAGRPGQRGHAWRCATSPSARAAKATTSPSPRATRGRRARRHRRRAQPHGRASREGAAVNGFNLSDWALGHRSFVWYLMLADRAWRAASPTRGSAARRIPPSPSRPWSSRPAGPAPRSRR